ncbi:hypothetical protein [Desulfosporosinus nitroreducens]|uniref:Permuted papain-like amidase enzyme, YaeF/YiiX, C92 family n=1 Tax=Desulfosporosinus nitroreducens TaxID=2018668 RepID=A0ABT8QJ46_9FIRM|nr:hypothetical protein [Desulfosporosinus nitroreducens]MCO1600217.1 hypothetical protein [Desulfosporosinus nitroreducens]MDO0821306.1 hypothetical protein [Desulfosporosinus nitroreducens]
MLRIIKKTFLFPIGLVLLRVWTLSHCPFRFGYSYEDKSILGPIPSSTETILDDGSCVISAKVQPGDILLVRGNTWIDKIIRIITGSPYTHVAGVVNLDEAVDILPFKRTGFQKLRSYTGHADIFTCKDLTDEQRRKIVEHIVNKIGTKYDYKLVLWEASRYLLHWKWAYKAGNNILCSTLWAEAYRKAGVNLCPDILFPSPGDLGNATILQKVESY